MKPVYYFDTGFLPGYIGICLERKAYYRELKKLNVSEYYVEDNPWVGDRNTGACCLHMEMKYGEIVLLICIDCDKTTKQNRSDNQIATLFAHEAVHVMQSYRERMGMQGTELEFEAWLVQWYTSQFNLYFHNYRKEQRRKKRKVQSPAKQGKVSRKKVKEAISKVNKRKSK